MHHRIVLAAALSALGALPLLAQHPTSKPSSADARVIGTWEGTYKSQFSGGMELLVSRDSVWRGTMQLTADHPFPPLDVRELKVDGSKISWVNDLMGTPCKASGIIEGTTMKGEIVCDARTIAFSLAKK